MVPLRSHYCKEASRLMWATTPLQAMVVIGRQLHLQRMTLPFSNHGQLRLAGFGEF